MSNVCSTVSVWGRVDVIHIRYSVHVCVSKACLKVGETVQEEESANTSLTVLVQKKLFKDK